MHDTTYLTSTRTFDTGTKTAHNILAIDGNSATASKELRTEYSDPVQVFAQNGTKRLGSIGILLENDEIVEMKEEIIRLTESVRNMERESKEEYNELVAWCRNETDGLWEENRALKFELERVFDVLGSVEKRLKDLEVSNEQGRNHVDHLHEKIDFGFNIIQDEIRTIQTRLRHAQTCETSPQGTTIGIFDAQADIVMLKDGLGNVLDGLRWTGERVMHLEEEVDRAGCCLESLRDGMLNESEMVRDELLTIQARLRRTTAPVQVCGDAEAFLMNRMRAEMRGKDNGVRIQDKRALVPLLSKKQRRHLKRVEKQRLAKLAPESHQEKVVDGVLKEENGEIDHRQQNELDLDEKMLDLEEDCAQLFIVQDSGDKARRDRSGYLEEEELKGIKRNE
ncbi:hypothetical protein R3P38DRAFT_2795096 [Favolaschia claudopus]|uniref:Uncharacterized protein n=1 Tax=Favolaschia claudopus TaxID=2862362 RepID=A0AAW0A7G0_9AGAR